jgi:hypothetical protein
MELCFVNSIITFSFKNELHRQSLLSIPSFGKVLYYIDVCLIRLMSVIEQSKVLIVLRPQ